MLRALPTVAVPAWSPCPRSPCPRSLCDACGHEGPLPDRDAAEAAGKRLQRQAERVRAAVAVAQATADRQRGEAADAAAKDETLAATLSETLEVIDRVLQAALAKPRAEVYVAFHELVRSRAPQIEVAAAVQDEVDERRISRELGRDLGEAGIKFVHYWSAAGEGVGEWTPCSGDSYEKGLVDALPCMLRCAVEQRDLANASGDQWREDCLAAQREVESVREAYNRLLDEKLALEGQVVALHAVNDRMVRHLASCVCEV